jgi:hypothetical protein
MESRPCPHCRAKTWTGVEDVARAALPYRLDPQQLDTTAELNALQSGRLTWTRHSSGAVLLRSATVILARPAGTVPRQTVHADHACPGGTP